MAEADPGTVIEQVARQVLATSLRLRRGENVIIESWTHMLPWAHAFVLEARKLGVRTTVEYEDELTYWRSVESVKASDLGKMSEPEAAALAKTQGYVFLWGPEDRVRQNALPPEQRSALVAYNDRWYAIAEKAKVRGVRIELGRATVPAARQYGVSHSAWQEELLAASLVDPRTLQRDARRLLPKLRQGKTLRIRHANGTDLTLGLVGRAPVADDGIVDADDLKTGNNLTSIPAGAVYVAVDERHVEGTIVANRSSFLRTGAASGGTWVFEGNRLKEATYTSGQSNFDEPYAAAGPGRDQPGFLSIGLNPKLRLAPGMEDLERGTVLFGVGSNTFYGGKNKCAFQSWVGLHGAHVEIDGKPILADGVIL